MGKLSSVVAFLFVFACGGEDDPFVPGGGPDAPPRPDATFVPVDAAPDSNLSSDAPLAMGPPVISLIKPDEGQLVSGVVRFEVDVQDLDGVATVTGTIGGTQTFTFARVSPGSNIWAANFDTTPLKGLVAPTVIVRATDTTTASSQLGFEVVLDNEGPISSLDPANVRERRTVDGVLECGEDFDPVGNDAPNDGEAVPQLIELRARIVDVGNTGTLNTDLFVPHAGISNAQLYVLDDTTRPLVVDATGDGICDAINPTIVPKTVPMLANEAARLDLVGVMPAGASHFGPDALGGTTACTVGSDDADERPGAQCLGEPSVTRIIAAEFTGEPAIWGIPPVTNFNCAGFAFDARAANIADGWACAAVVTTDRLGNTRVSAPLRICVDADGNGAECAVWGSTGTPNRPNCTGTFTGGNVTNTACVARDFFRSGSADNVEIIDP